MNPIAIPHPDPLGSCGGIPQCSCVMSIKSFALKPLSFLTATPPASAPIGLPLLYHQVHASLSPNSSLHPLTLSPPVVAHGITGGTIFDNVLSGSIAIAKLTANYYPQLATFLALFFIKMNNPKTTHLSRCLLGSYCMRPKRSAP